MTDRAEAPIRGGLPGRLVEVCLDATSAGAFWPDLMSELARVIDFDTGYIASTPSGAAAAHGALLGYGEHELRATVGDYLREIQPEEVRRYLDRACTEEEIWTPRRRAQLSVFRRNVLPSPIRHMLVRVSWHGGVLVGFNLERRGPGRGFSPADAATIDALAPLVQLADVVTRRRSGPDPLALWAREFGLSPREAEIANLAMKGETNKQIAQHLGLSPFTVRNIMQKVFAAVGVERRSELGFELQAAAASATDTGDDGTNGARRDGVAVFANRVRGLLPPPPSEPARHPDVVFAGALRLGG
jgi:DNA-binding CsgD family transcriptional regulator